MTDQVANMFGHVQQPSTISTPVAYYLAKCERPFTYYAHLITLENKNHDKDIGRS